MKDFFKYLSQNSELKKLTKEQKELITELENLIKSKTKEVEKLDIRKDKLEKAIQPTEEKLFDLREKIKLEIKKLKTFKIDESKFLEVKRKFDSEQEKVEKIKLKIQELKQEQKDLEVSNHNLSKKHEFYLKEVTSNKKLLDKIK